MKVILRLAGYHDYDDSGRPFIVSVCLEITCDSCAGMTITLI